MTRNFGIDTSILVRLVTGDPQDSFQSCVEVLSALIRGKTAAIVASNQVIGKAYVALQHHYGVTKTDARTGGLASVLDSGLVAPLNGESVFQALAADQGCGLLDRLIADDYSASGLRTLTLDRKMAALPDTEILTTL